MPTVSLICLDFDGTVMTYDEPPGFLHPAVIEVLNGLAARGVVWCTDSGRDVAGQVGIIEKSCEKGLVHLPEALLCAECFIYTRRGDEYEGLEPWNSQVHADLRAFHARVHEALVPEMDALIRKYQPERVYLEEEATVFLVPTEDARPSRLTVDLQRILERVPRGMVTRNAGWVVVLPDHLGKGNVLAAYLRHAGLARERVLAIGDHLNDINMLDGRAARHVGCPADAIPEVAEVVRIAGGHVARASGPPGAVEIIRHFVGL